MIASNSGWQVRLHDGDDGDGDVGDDNDGDHRA